MLDRLAEMLKRRSQLERDLKEIIDDLVTLYGRERIRRLLAENRAAIRKRP